MSRSRLFVAALVVVLGAGGALAQTSPRSPGALPKADEWREASTVRALAQMVVAERGQNDFVSPQSVSDDDSLFGAIRGMVRSFDPTVSGEARVWAFRMDSTASDSAVVYSGEVKDDGFYLISGLPQGEYLVAVRAPGSASQFYDHVETASDATPVYVRAGETVENIDFDLQPFGPGSGGLSGQVLDAETGQPVPAAEISAFPADGGFWSGHARTDEEGRYVVSGLPTGRYFVEARSPSHLVEYFDGARWLSEATTVQVTEPDTTIGIDFALDTGGRISGLVTDQYGAPLEGVHVWAAPYANWEDSVFVDVSPHRYASATTGPDGSYLLGSLESGDYFVTAVYGTEFYRVQVLFDGVYSQSEATPVPVAEGEETTGIDLAIDLPEDLGGIAGRILDSSGAGIEQAMVWIVTDHRWTDATGTVEPGPSGDIGVPDVGIVIPAEPDGSYRVEGIPAGTYIVAAEILLPDRYLMVWHESALSRELADTVVVESGTVTEGVNVIVPSLEGVISGTVTNTDGTPIPGATVWTEPEQSPVYVSEQVALTDSLGRYTVKGLPDGRYRLVASACGGLDCVRRWWRDSESFEEADVVDLVDGVTVQGSIDFVLPLRLGRGSISGRVTGPGGEPLKAQVYGYALNADGSLSGGLVVGTDRSGDYTLKGLFEGQWIISATYYDGESRGVVWYENAASQDEATPISLGLDEQLAGIDMVIDARPIWGTLTGEVAYEFLDVVIQRGYVEILPSYSDSLRRYYAPFIVPRGVPVREGRYEITGLAEGDYLVSVYVQNAFEVYDGVRTLVEATPVRVRGGETTVVDFMLNPHALGDGVVAGMVRDVEGAPVGIAVVEAVPAGDVGEVGFPTVTRADGSYSITGLAPGTYLIRAWGPDHAPVFYDGTYDPAEATEIEVSEVPVEGIDFELPAVYYRYGEDDRSALPGSMTVFGTVADEAGTPIAGAIVYVMHADGTVAGFARSGIDGNYHIGGLMPADNYVVEAVINGFDAQFNGGATDIGGAESLDWNGGPLEVNFRLQQGTTTPVERDDTPEAFRLVGNYPNPFNPATTIRFDTPETGMVSVAVYDLLGRAVARLLDESLPAGEHRVRFDARAGDGSELPSGVYIYRVVMNDQSLTGRMVLLR